MTIHAHKIVTPAFRKEAGAVSPEQLAVINRYALAELTAEQVYVRTAYLAHNAIDRDGEVFDDSLLDSFAVTLPGKGLFVRHPGSWDGDSGPGIGRWFSARTVTMSLDEARTALREPNLKWPPSTQVAKLLETSAYMPRSGKNADLIADVDAGVAGDVSIGFRATDRSAITDGAGNTIAMRILGPGEALEGSLVWLGAQPGARVVKNLNRNESEQENPMTPEEIKALQAKLDAQQAKVALYDAILAAIGKELAENPTALKRAVDDAKSHRDALIDGIVAAERLSGMVGDDDKSVAEAKAQYADQPIAKLVAWKAKLDKAAPAGAALKGGDPNATHAIHPDQRTDKGAVPSPLNNPAVTG